MDWNVKNAINRDVERQHLNKILKDVKKSLDDSNHRLWLLEQVNIQDIAGQVVAGGNNRNITVTYDPRRQAVDFVVGELTTSEEDEDTGEGNGGGSSGGGSSGGGNSGGGSSGGSSGGGGIGEAPMDGYAYWRRTGEWDVVGEQLERLAWIDGPGFPSLSSMRDWNVRIFQGTANEIDVADGDGELGNPTFSLADLTNTGVGVSPVKIYTRDSKGRIAGDQNASTSNLPEGSNLYYTDARVYSKVKSILQAGSNVTLTPNDISQQITISSTGGGGGGGGVNSVIPGEGIDVDNTDPDNPVVSVEPIVIQGVHIITLEAASTIHNNRAVVADLDTIYHPSLSSATDGRIIVGISRQSGSTSDPVMVQTSGPLTNGGWSWASGPVYVDDDGVLTQTAPSTGWIVCVGTAIATDTIDIKVSRPIIRS